MKYRVCTFVAFTFRGGGGFPFDFREKKQKNRKQWIMANEITLVS